MAWAITLSVSRLSMTSRYDFLLAASCLLLAACSLLLAASDYQESACDLADSPPLLASGRMQDHLRGGVGKYTSNPHHNAQPRGWF